MSNRAQELARRAAEEGEGGGFESPQGKLTGQDRRYSGRESSGKKSGADAGIHVSDLLFADTDPGSGSDPLASDARTKSRRNTTSPKEMSSYKRQRPSSSSQRAVGLNPNSASTKTTTSEKSPGGYSNFQNLSKPQSSPGNSASHPYVTPTTVPSRGGVPQLQQQTPPAATATPSSSWDPVLRNYGTSSSGSKPEQKLTRDQLNRSVDATRNNLDEDVFQQRLENTLVQPDSTSRSRDQEEEEERHQHETARPDHQPQQPQANKSFGTLPPKPVALWAQTHPHPQSAADAERYRQEEQDEEYNYPHHTYDATAPAPGMMDKLLGKQSSSQRSPGTADSYHQRTQKSLRDFEYSPRTSTGSHGISGGWYGGHSDGGYQQQPQHQQRHPFVEEQHESPVVYSPLHRPSGSSSGYGRGVSSSAGSPKLTPRSPGTSYQGFSNLGNTCYAGAVLTLLLRCETISAALTNVVDRVERSIVWYDDEITKLALRVSGGEQQQSAEAIAKEQQLHKFASSGLEASGPLHKALYELCTALANKSQYVSPAGLQRAMDEFFDTEQHDAHEFLTQVVDTLEAEAKVLNKFWQDSGFSRHEQLLGNKQNTSGVHRDSAGGRKTASKRLRTSAELEHPLLLPEVVPQESDYAFGHQQPHHQLQQQQQRDVVWTDTTLTSALLKTFACQNVSCGHKLNKIDPLLMSPLPIEREKVESAPNSQRLGPQQSPVDDGLAAGGVEETATLVESQFGAASSSSLGPMGTATGQIGLEVPAAGAGVAGGEDQPPSIQELLDHQLKTNRVEDYRCEKCGDKKRQYESNDFVHPLPPILLAYLLRFKHRVVNGEWEMYKNKAQVVLSPEITVRSFVFVEDEEKFSELFPQMARESSSKKRRMERGEGGEGADRSAEKGWGGGEDPQNEEAEEEEQRIIYRKVRRITSLYRLSGIIRHLGNDPWSGHYIAEVAVPDHHANDRTRDPLQGATTGADVDDRVAQRNSAGSVSAVKRNPYALPPPVLEGADLHDERNPAHGDAAGNTTSPPPAMKWLLCNDSRIAERKEPLPTQASSKDSYILRYEFVRNTESIELVGSDDDTTDDDDDESGIRFNIEREEEGGGQPTRRPIFHYQQQREQDEEESVDVISETPRTIVL